MTNATELNKKLESNENICLLDVRTGAEFSGYHIASAKNIPLHELEKRMNELQRDKPLYVMCGSGNRSKKACEILEKAGFEKVVDVSGGVTGWKEAGYPVVENASHMSIERQVRIAAGALVLTGVILGQFVNPAFIWVSGFVGAGLVFAGVTDFCGMGLLLARMPWNKR